MSKATQSEAEPGVALEINGQEVQAREGQTILEAARDAGIEIPTLCEHEPLTNVGGCRMCLVEIDGKRTETACTTTVQDGMEIEVDTDDLWDHRRTILELMFSEQNHYCMYCEMEGDCELEDLFNEAGLDACDYPLEYNDVEVDTSHEHITLDLDRCVLCGRCVRTCDEIVGNDTLTFKDRGLETEIVADDGVALGDSSCISCGACAQACPTGAIYTSQSAYRGREEDCDVVTTTCTECSLGCELEVYTNSGRIVKIEGVEDGPDGGQLCEMGRFGLFGDRRERVDTTSIRGEGTVEVKDALDRTRELLAGAETVDAVASDRLPTEVVEAFADSMDAYDAAVEIPGAQRAADERRIAERVAPMFNKHAGNLRARGPEAVLEAEAVAVFDTSIVDTHPVAASYVRRAAKDGATLISVDSDEDRFGAKSDASIESGTGLSRLTEDAFEVVDEDASALADSDTETLINAVPALEDGAESFIVLGPEVEEEDTLINAYALAGMTDSRVLSLPDRVNAFENGVGTDDLHEDPDVAYLFAGDDRDDDLDRMLEVARKADTVIVQATRESILTKAADVVVPALDWFERTGTITDASGTDRELARVLKPRVAVDSDREVLATLADTAERAEVEQ
ncbi:2Fe-2S iron-sulfur cluster-binding protein [Halapricum desulfuricans]|uniref:Putative molibdopterin-dependent oxidoreductaseYjgC n=1 Tax=Halapricum desulfuricans TaxID=2841257 RepID=A0A897ND24_9EURY|nr:2Fe-2S iron-sulfur cluster-binding protein [Halapricum desulfuricans]QSG10314.1 putative molibdopterin-dependent oxidoreductaseYjgC [Halapricum desulfuricans]